MAAQNEKLRVVVVGGVAGGHHLNPAVHRFGHGLGDVQLLLLRQKGHLTGLADGKYAGAALLDIPVAKAFNGLEVGLVIVRPRGDHDRPNAGGDGKRHGSPSSALTVFHSRIHTGCKASSGRIVPHVHLIFNSFNKEKHGASAFTPRACFFRFSVYSAWP